MAEHAGELADQVAGGFESLRRFGLQPAGSDIELIRELLLTQTELERQSQGHGDTALMKLCCVAAVQCWQPTGCPDDLAG